MKFALEAFLFALLVLISSINTLTTGWRFRFNYPVLQAATNDGALRCNFCFLWKCISLNSSKTNAFSWLGRTKRTGSWNSLLNMCIAPRKYWTWSEILVLYINKCTSEAFRKNNGDWQRGQTWQFLRRICIFWGLVLVHTAQVTWKTSWKHLISTHGTSGLKDELKALEWYTRVWPRKIWQFEYGTFLIDFCSTTV